MHQLYFVYRVVLYEASQNYTFGSDTKSEDEVIQSNFIL